MNGEEVSTQMTSRFSKNTSDYFRAGGHAFEWFRSM
jgi:hypothetical protein